MADRTQYVSFSEMSSDSTDDSSGRHPVAERIRRVSSGVLARTKRTLSILEPPRNLGFGGAVLCVVGECAGTGMLTLPKIIADTGWAGIVFMVFISLTAAYTAHLLTRCWAMVLETNPTDCNYIPYQAIGYRTFGHKMRSLVALLHCLSLFCVGTMALILSSEILQTLFGSVGFAMSHCYWMLILSVFCFPLTWLGGSEYMSTIVVICGLGTVVSSLLILATTTIVKVESKTTWPTAMAVPTLWTVLSGVGKIAYTFGGHDAYPNIQNNVHKPEYMSRMIAVAYSVLIIVYYPLAIVPFYTLGTQIKHQDVQVSLMSLTNTKWLLVVSQILMCCHLFTNIIISLNPFLLEAEKMVGVEDKDRGVKQIITRAMLFSMCLFIAQSLPNFAGIIALIGSSTEMMLSYILPCVFYERLCMLERHRKHNPFYMKILHHKIIIVGLILGIGGTFVALDTLFGDDTFVPPCYSNVTVGY